MDPKYEPFLRWAGGKRWLADSLCPLLREIQPKLYLEPFLGSGALFFGLAPKKAVLSDLNEDLINAYREVAKNPYRILASVEAIPLTKRAYYSQRKSKPDSSFERAVRFIYLNRTCYGGIYRENRKGEFNTPFGGGSRTPAPLRDNKLLTKANKLLSHPGITLKVSDFEDVMYLASETDVIYCDPTYHSVTGAQFNRYGATIFNWNDQIRLARAALLASSRGATIIISNAYCKEIKNLYQGSYRIRLNKHKSIGKLNTNPVSNQEYLIILDPFERAELWRELGKIEKINQSKITKAQELKLISLIEDKKQQLNQINQDYSRSKSSSITLGR